MDGFHRRGVGKKGVRYGRAQTQVDFVCRNPRSYGLDEMVYAFYPSSSDSDAYLVFPDCQPNVCLLGLPNYVGNVFGLYSASAAAAFASGTASIYGRTVRAT